MLHKLDHSVLERKQNHCYVFIIYLDQLLSSALCQHFANVSLEGRNMNSKHETQRGVKITVVSTPILRSSIKHQKYFTFFSDLFPKCKEYLLDGPGQHWPWGWSYSWDFSAKLLKRGKDTVKAIAKIHINFSGNLWANCTPPRQTLNWEQESLVLT